MSPSDRSHQLIYKVMQGRRLGPVTQALMIMNVVWFVYMTAAGVNPARPDPLLLVRFGALFGPLIYEGETWRLVSYMFVHIGLLHIGFNTYVLYALGRDLEVLYGRIPFIIIYFFAGLCGGLASLWAHPVTLSAGASGAIFGLAGAAISFYFRLHDPTLKRIFARWKNSLLLFIGYNVVFGLMIPGIDNFAHMGGLISGFVMGYIIASPEASEQEGLTRISLGLVFGVGVLYAIGRTLGLSL